MTEREINKKMKIDRWTRVALASYGLIALAIVLSMDLVLLIGGSLMLVGPLFISVSDDIGDGCVWLFTWLLGILVLLSGGVIAWDHGQWWILILVMAAILIQVSLAGNLVKESKN